MYENQLPLIDLPKEKETISCPVCQTLCTGKPVYSYTASQAAAHFCPKTRDKDRYNRLLANIRKLWQGNESVIINCDNCEFNFGYPFVGGDEEFYSILHEQKEYPTWRWDYDVALQEVINPLKTGKLLEIGAGAGLFLKRINKEWQCYAAEGSESTRKNLEAFDIEVFRDLDLANEIHQHTFDVVVIFQVLEHISEFNKVLDCCHKFLKKGGKIVITVPDKDAMIRQEKVTGCPDMPPNHINKWSSNSLALTLQKHGFEPQPSIFEPSSWQNFKGSLHLKIMNDATNNRSLAAQIYRIKNKSLRIPLLAIIAIPALFKMLPYFKELSKAGAFAMIATAI